MAEPSVLQIFVFKAGQYVGSEVFTEEEIVIGNGAGVDLAIDDEQVASNHAILSHANEQATLLDLGAPGGTQINRTAIQHSYVTPRDEIQIGSHTLKIKFMSGKKSLKPAPAASLSQPAALANDLKGDEPTQIQRADSTQKRSQQYQIATDVVPKEPQGASIEDLLDKEIARTFDQITASIEISGSDVVAARPISGLHTPKRPQQAKRPESKPKAAPKGHDAGPTGPIRVPQPARAQTPVVDDLHGPATQPVFQAVRDPIKETAPTPIQTPIARIGPPDDARPMAPVDTADLSADEIDDWTRPGFSLIGKLREAERTIRPGPALEVIGFSDDDVRAAELLVKKGERFRLGRGKHAEAPDAGYPGLKIAQLVADGVAEIQFPTAASGWVETQGKRTPLDSLKVPENAVSKKGDAFRTTLNRGSTAVIQFGGTGYYFRFVEPPPIRTEPLRLALDGTIAKAIASSFVVHAMVLVVVALFSEGVSYSDVPREEWAEIQQDDLRDVEVKPEPEPEPEPEPVVEEAEPEPEPEPEPQPQKKPPKRKAAAPKGFTKEEVKTAGVLGAMGKLNLKAPGKKSMVAAVSNIDAVRAPGGSNFRVGALVGKLPSSQVSVGGGGGGKLLTRGGAELLKGGTGFAKIGKQGAKVRGRVDRINSTRLVSKGSISREEVAAVINKHLGEVHYCYETTLMKDPGLQGKLVLEWVINANGSVGKVKQKTSTLKNPGVASCIMDRLRRWQFPKPRGGVVIVSYPFIFSPVGF